MLLTITTTHVPATDLGYLLHKNPARLQIEDLTFGKAHVFYPDANESRCTMALMLEVDPVGLVRGRRGPAGEGGQLEQYVNDRPYAANSFLSVAMGRLFASALNGKSRDRQPLAETPIPLEAHLPVVAARGGGEDLVRRLFGPLGYQVMVNSLPLDDRFPEWGGSPYLELRLAATVTLQTMLTHLYVLIPVLDNEKHYWIGDDEVEKLLKRGEGWLANHPEKELIVSRYLKRQRALTRQALEQLAEDAVEENETTPGEPDEREEKVERPIGLHEQRIGTVLSVLRGLGAKKILDLGCGEGKLLRQLVADTAFEKILGMDVSWRSIEIASDKLKLSRLPERQRARLELIQGSLMYRDSRLNGFDAAAIVEVIEHLDAARLAAFERVLFEFARPSHVVLTTPNVEYNALFPTLPAGQFRHRDHRFEWSREEFTRWADRIAENFDYQVRIQPVGPVDQIHGAPSQMAIFSRKEGGQ